MRAGRLQRIAHGGVLALLLSTMPYVALAADALIPQDGAGGDPTIVAQPGPSTPVQSPPGQLTPSTTFVEDPTRQAGGEDDAQRVNERSSDQQNNDDGGHRRK
jgi:hypothetical protein